MLELLSDAGDRGKEDLADLRTRLQGRAQRLKEGALKGQADLRAAAESAATGRTITHMKIPGRSLRRRA